MLLAHPGAPSKLPVLIHRLDSPIELLPQSLGEEALNRNAELLGEDDREAGIDVVLQERSVSNSNEPSIV